MLFCKIMALSRLLRISRLYPSNVEDLTKSFRSSSSVREPYGLSIANSLRRQIQDLVGEVETGGSISDLERTNRPYSGNLDDRVDAVNSATTVRTDDISRQVPNEIRFIQLAHLHDPEVDGYRYSYGLMLHYGEYAPPDGPEFAILLPYERDEDVSAMILSNNCRDVHCQKLDSIVKALAYARKKASE